MEKKNIESVYPLTPMQQGMLFHTLLQPESFAYFEQVTWRFEGPLDVAAFKQAWQYLIERHAIFRTAFIWKGQEKQLQVVLRTVELPWTELDWRDIPPQEQEVRLEEFMQAEREKGLDLGHPPAMRLQLIRLGEQTYHFLWNHHHVLLDGWSLPIVMRELFTCYEYFRRGQEVALTPIRPYKEYIAWLGKQDINKAEAFWRQKLDGFTAPTPFSELVGLRSRGDTPSHAEMHFTLSRQDTDKLQMLAKSNQLTISTVLQGAWAIVLSRYSGKHDVLFGVTTAGRPPEVEGVESMIGLFINTLPFRVQVRPDACLVSWLKELQAQHVEMRQYEHSPLIQVQQWSPIAPPTPLFETLMIFENYPLDVSFEGSGLSVDVQSLHTIERTNYPITVVGYPMAELEFFFSYDTNVFDVATIQNLGLQLKALLESFQPDPELRLSDLSLLSAADRQRMLYEWNDTRHPYPEKCYHALFEEQAERTPNAIAVLFEERTLTYAELNQQANQLAHYLMSLGVQPETPVGICFDRSPEMIVAVMGALKAGAAYVPLDPAYPKERLAFIIRDTHMPVILTQQPLLQKLPAYEGRAVCLDTEWEQVTQASRENPACRVMPDNLAYVIYTSGSTGQPKGVLVPHKGLANVSEEQVRIFGLSEQDRMLQFASLNFDGATFEIVLPLRVGGTLCMGTRESLLPGAGLARFLKDKKITLVTITPSALAALPVEDMPDLRVVTVAGEACSAELVARWSSTRKFFNLYGPTETTIWVTQAECSEAPQPPPIGRPIHNVQTYVLDRDGLPTPMGVPGELVVGGVGVVRGYLNRPDLTAEMFIPDSFSRQAGACLYRTGDLVRYRPDGNLEFLGRIDQQVKIRGIRVELGEIEAALRQHPAIQEAAVVVREDHPGEQRLIAYFVPAVKPPPSLRQLRRALQEWLPDHMVPAVFIVLESMPLKPSGKLDYRALPVPDASGQVQREKTYVAPQSGIEEKIATIWQKVLHIEKVGANDNFFDLGGTSLSIVRAHEELQSAFGREFPLSEMFKYPTTSALAQYLGQEEPSGPAVEKVQDRVAKQRDSMMMRRKQMTQGKQKTDE